MIQEYKDKDITTLSPREQVRLRPGMYIGKLGDGTQKDDGIYIILKETMDNSIDEFTSGTCTKIIVKYNSENKEISIEDNGRGIPLGKLESCFSEMNTSGKYGSEAYSRSVGLHGVGAKITNWLSTRCTTISYREGKSLQICYEDGNKIKEIKGKQGNHFNGTFISYIISEDIFGPYNYNLDFIRERFRNYVCLNSGLTIEFHIDNKEPEIFYSENGLNDLLSLREDSKDFLYDPIHLKGEHIEVSLTHSTDDSEILLSFVNGQYTSQGGTHQLAYREAISKTLREHLKNKDFEASDVRNGIVAAIRVAVNDPAFESQTKIKLSSKYMDNILKDITIRQYILDFINTELSKYLLQNQDVEKKIREKAEANLKERKAISGIKKKARETLKKASLNNKKLRDCKIHFTDKKNELHENSMCFIVEGLSAGCNFITARDPKTQAVFSLRGKPLNTYGLTKKIIYDNEEFALLDSALGLSEMENIDEYLNYLRYNKIVIATDQDTDGFHIRLLLLTFLAQFYPYLIENGHLYTLDTPLFRVRNKQKTVYCYTEKDRDKALKVVSNSETTRFKGLGEISGDEFKKFIGEDIHLRKITFEDISKIKEVLKFYMGPNTQDRQDYVMSNLRSEETNI